MQPNRADDAGVVTRVRASALSVVVTRKDGTVEDLGVVGYTSSNPVDRARYAALAAPGKRIDLAALFRPVTPLGE